MTPRVTSDHISRFDSSIRAEVDLAAFRHNLALAETLARGVPIMAVVKADAYGHGIENVLPVLQEAAIKVYAVANLAEGIRLRTLGVRRPILVFGGPLDDQIRLYAEHDLDITIAGEASLRSVLTSGARLRAHLKVDTGMHRLGIRPLDAAQAVRAVRQSESLELASVWTHLATADEEDLSFAHRQIEDFDACLRGGDASVPTHVANTGALARIEKATTGRAFVRPGGILYGMPSSRTLERLIPMRPVMRLVSRVVHVQTVQKGESVSYARSWVAERDTRIATVAAGYADGVSRHLSNIGTAGIRGNHYPIVGRVCMDMLMLDIGPDASGVSVGDEVVLFGAGGPSLIDQAEAAASMSYTLPAGLTSRVPRVAASR